MYEKDGFGLAALLSLGCVEKQVSVIDKAGQNFTLSC
jgi:hypothetical protein